MRVTRLRSIVGVVVALLLAAVLAGCGSDDEASDLPRIDLFVGTQPFGTIFVAEDQGLFKKEGVDVRVNRFSSGTEATEAFRAASAGLFVAGDMPSLLAWENGDVVGVAPISADVTTFSLVVGKGVSEAADLRGKKLATVVGSTGDIFIRSYLKNNGLDFSDIELVNLGPGDMAPALARGDIDGFAWLGAEISTGVESTDGATILQEGTEGYVVNHIILSATKNVLEDEDAIQGVIRALLKAQDIVNDDPDSAVDSVVKVTEMNPETARSDLERIDYDMTYTADFGTEMNDIIDLAESADFLQTGLELESVFDTGPLGAVDPELVEGGSK